MITEKQMKKVKTMRSYAARARFIADESENPVGWLASCALLRSVCAHSPTKGVYWHDDGYPVVTVEVKHRVYVAYDVSGAALHKDEGSAEREYLQAYRAR